MAKKFSEIFCGLLKENDISALKVAKDIGIPKTIVYEWKDGKREPTLENFIKLSDYFGVSAEYLSGKAESDDDDKQLIVMLRAAKKISPDDHDALVADFKKNLAEYLKKNGGSTDDGQA